MKVVSWRRGRVPCLLRRVLVNLTGEDYVLSGVLFEHRGEWLVLRDARITMPGKEPVRVDGDVVIGCNKVAFIQALGS